MSSYEVRCASCGGEYKAGHLCAELFDDLLIAREVRRRIANDTGERITLEDLAREFGFDLEELRAAVPPNKEPR